MCCCKNPRYIGCVDICKAYDELSALDTGLFAMKTGDYTYRLKFLSNVQDIEINHSLGNAIKLFHLPIFSNFVLNEHAQHEITVFDPLGESVGCFIFDIIKSC